MHVLARQSSAHMWSSTVRTFSYLLVLATWAGMLSSCRARVKPIEPVEVEVRQVSFDHLSNSPVVLLQDKEKTKTMPIWIGPAEAQAITLQLQGVDAPRPLTHDLMKNILEQTGILVDKVLVTELKGSTYYARIHLHHGEKTLDIDSRPSDAIALALRLHRPIFVEGTLFAASRSLDAPENKVQRGKEASAVSASAVFFGLTVQDLTHALAAHFGLPGNEGVLVADVNAKSNANNLQRGDVILSVQGEKARNMKELQALLEKGREDSVTLQVYRDGQNVEISFDLSQQESAKNEEENE